MSVQTIEISYNGEIITITIPEPTPAKKTRQYLHTDIIDELAIFISNKRDLLCGDPEYKKYYSLFCVVVDRLKTATAYLNKHNRLPKNEEQVISFLIYACMIYDAVSVLMEKVQDLKKYHEIEKNYFKEICMGKPWNLTEDECLTDEEFFEHFRSLVFAHPYNTDRKKILKEKYGQQYSPYIIAGQPHHPKKIGVMIYPEKSLEFQRLTFDFSILKKYIQYRYSQIAEVTELFKKLVQKKEDELNGLKIKRTTDFAETLKNANQLLETRCIDFYGRMDILIDFLEYENHVPENANICKEYKEAISAIVPPLCDAIDNADYDKAHGIIDTVLCEYSPQGGTFDYCFSKLSDSYHDKTGNTWLWHKDIITGFFERLDFNIKTESFFDIIDYYFLLCAYRYFKSKEYTP